MKTIDLRGYRTSTHAPAMIFAAVLVALILLNGLAEWRAPQPQIATPTPGLIYVLSTREPQPTADPRLQQEIAELRARLAELEAREQAVPEAEQPVIYQQMSVQAEPTPTAFVADPLIGQGVDGSMAAIAVPTDAPRLCSGFGDWRDYDAMYQASPVCHQ